MLLSLVPLLPLLAAIVAGTVGLKRPALAHTVTTAGVGVAMVAAFITSSRVIGAEPLHVSWYDWAFIQGYAMHVGLWLDGLSAVMISVVTFVSFLVHVYAIGYMKGDPGYGRFFAYISFFTFGMLMLVLADGFVQLFFGWEAVGLASYLLIGFWFTRPSATAAGLKAFLVNRVGDMGFLLGIALLFTFAGSLQYGEVFAQADRLAETRIGFWGMHGSVLTLSCLLLFVGAMGKSAQLPLQVWLPDSMEGPTPISALIHAATMVTAGIFMVARLSPLFELSTTALTVVLVIGTLTAFLMGLVGVVQTDIKRVIAYSTLSQLGYMTAALGASAYSVAIFHLVTHAFFKALLFLAAGSVIIAMHHEQDMRRMGGLRRVMPITFWTSLCGSLALIGFPGFSGFFSKDAILEAVAESRLPGAGFAWLLLLLSVFVTGLYTFRLIFMVFFGELRQPKHDTAHGDHESHEHHEAHHEPTESPFVVWLPLAILAVPSVLAGFFLWRPLGLGTWLRGVVVTHEGGEHAPGAMAFAMHGLMSPAIYLAVAGAAAAWYAYVANPALPERLRQRMVGVWRILINQYGFEALYSRYATAVARGLGLVLWRAVDAGIVDGVMVGGTVGTMGRLGRMVKRLQSGYLYHYAFAMIVAVVLLVAWLGWGGR
jgi:NADH-quinone oxidoreductase subunit L